MSEIILPSDSTLYREFERMVAKRQMVFLAGLPGVGKSLLLNQLACMAEAAGRRVHLLQWDVARSAFETAVVLDKYPEIDGVTHAAVRKCVGVWSRQAVSEWYAQYQGTTDMLIGEVPLIGNRLIELVQRLDDEAEACLAQAATLFVLPVPSRSVRAAIEAARTRNSREPQHEKERKDALPNVLQMLWQEVAVLGQELKLTAEGYEVAGYDPDVYTAVYRYLLQHRQQQTLPVDILLSPQGSVYDLQVSGGELAATAVVVDNTVARIEKEYTAEALDDAVNNWFQIG